MRNEDPAKKMGQGQEGRQGPGVRRHPRTPGHDSLGTCKILRYDRHVSYRWWDVLGGNSCLLHWFVPDVFGVPILLALLDLGVVLVPDLGTRSPKNSCRVA